MAELKLNSGFLILPHLFPSPQNPARTLMNDSRVAMTPSNIHTKGENGGTETRGTWDLLRELRNSEQQTGKSLYQNQAGVTGPSRGSKVQGTLWGSVLTISEPRAAKPVTVLVYGD